MDYFRRFLFFSLLNKTKWNKQDNYNELIGRMLLQMMAVYFVSCDDKSSSKHLNHVYDLLISQFHSAYNRC